MAQPLLPTFSAADCIPLTRSDKGHLQLVTFFNPQTVLLLLVASFGDEKASPAGACMK
jgi:hypothetical protein